MNIILWLFILWNRNHWWFLPFRLRKIICLLLRFLPINLKFFKYCLTLGDGWDEFGSIWKVLEFCRTTLLFIYTLIDCPKNSGKIFWHTNQPLEHYLTDLELLVLQWEYIVTSLFSYELKCVFYFLKGENSVHDVRAVPIRCLLKWLRAGSSLCCRTIEIREAEVCNVTRDVVGRLENMGEWLGYT